MTDNQRMADVVCAIAKLGYANGKTGIQIAEEWIFLNIDALIAVRDARAKNPAAFPGYGEGTSEESARRIIARLLDAGWRPPDSECLDLSAIPEVTT